MTVDSQRLGSSHSFRLHFLAWPYQGIESALRVTWGYLRCCHYLNCRLHITQKPYVTLTVVNLRARPWEGARVSASCVLWIHSQIRQSECVITTALYGFELVEVLDRFWRLYAHKFWNKWIASICLSCDDCGVTYKAVVVDTRRQQCTGQECETCLKGTLA